MKTSFSAILITILTLSSVLAGTIQNEKTLETIQVKQSEHRILTNIEGVNGTAYFVKPQKDDKKLYPLTEKICDQFFYSPQYPDTTELSCALVLIGNTPVVLAATLETLILPVTATKKLVKNLTYKKDYKTILRAAQSEETIIVSEKRFDRIKTHLGQRSIVNE